MYKAIELCLWPRRAIIVGTKTLSLHNTMILFEIKELQFVLERLKHRAMTYIVTTVVALNSFSAPDLVMYLI